MQKTLCLRTCVRRIVLCVSFAVSTLSPALGIAAEADFKDVPSSHFASQAIIYVKQQGIMAGYPDGTFQPDRMINRAEALKIITTALIPENEKKKVAGSPFADVPDGAWYLPYVDWAAQGGKIIDGPPKKPKFFPDRSVTKAEFIKMFVASRTIDANSFGDIIIPLSSDVKNTKEWFYPYMRYAVASSMTQVTKAGIYSPHRELTRGDVAVLMHRYFLYRAGQRTQDILSETEKEITTVITSLDNDNAIAADYASGRAVLMIRGAREIRPNEPMVKVVVKIAEGYRALVRAYRAAEKEEWKMVVKHSQDAWYLGDQAKKITPQAETLASQLQKYARSFAEQARGAQ